MSQYNGTISTGQSTEASSSRIYIECFHTQITSKCPILYKHRMNHSGEFKAISSVYRKTREFNLKQMFVFSSHCSLEELTTVHSPAVISLLASPTANT